MRSRTHLPGGRRALPGHHHLECGAGVGLTSDTGAFWFFAASNLELVVKVLDGCALNGHYWVFAAGLTDVAVTLTVTDTQTVQSQSFTNPPGVPFPPLQDTAAFATCP